MSEHRSRSIDNSSPDRTVMFGGSGRDHSVDMMRCISCLMVVVIHVCAYLMAKCPYDASAGVSGAWLSMAVLKCISASATNLFLMISGIFFLSPERDVPISRIWSRNILKLACAYAVWCMIYAAFRICCTEHLPFTWGAFFRESLNREFHLWYLPMMIGIYVIVPFLRFITARAQRKHYLYLIGLMAGAMALTTLRTLSEQFPYAGSESVTTLITFTPAALICQYPCYCILGYYLYTYRPMAGTRSLIYALGILSVLLTVCLFTYIYKTTGATNPDPFRTKFTVGLLAKNSAIFIFVLTLFSKVRMGDRFKRILTKVSGSTLFIYLSHILMLYILLQERWLLDTGLNMFLIACIYIAVIYLAGFLFSLIFLQSIPWIKARDIVLDAVWPDRRIWRGGPHRS